VGDDRPVPVVRNHRGSGTHLLLIRVTVDRNEFFPFVRMLLTSPLMTPSCRKRIFIATRFMIPKAGASTGGRRISQALRAATFPHLLLSKISLLVPALSITVGRFVFSCSLGALAFGWLQLVQGRRCHLLGSICRTLMLPEAVTAGSRCYFDHEDFGWILECDRGPGSESCLSSSSAFGLSSCCVSSLS